MIKRILFLLTLVCITMSMTCREEIPPKALKLEDGTYTGTFRRFSATDTQVAQVSLVINGNSWTGSSSIDRYPALCSGTFTHDTINYLIDFQNDCMWTADFDWTLILKGTFNIGLQDGAIIFRKEYNGNILDLYTLNKQ